MPVKLDQSMLLHLPLAGSCALVCISYAPGYTVHWIQALHGANDKAVAAQAWSGKVVTVEGEVVTVRKPDGSLALFQIPDPAGLVVILQDGGVAVTVNDQYAIMRAGIALAGSFWVSVQVDKGEPLGPCKIGDLAPSATALHAFGGGDD